tara:strand:+ start:208 stop:474 length:267 start_codon:yes stop_codon:yes gene_type:complete
MTGMISAIRLEGGRFLVHYKGKQSGQGAMRMPIIGWVFLLGAIALVLGGLFMLRDSTNMRISKEKMKKIQARKAQVEAEESAEDREQW